MWTRVVEACSPCSIIRIVFFLFVVKDELTLKVMDTIRTLIKPVFVENESTRLCNVDQFTAVCVASIHTNCTGDEAHLLVMYCIQLVCLSYELWDQKPRHGLRKWTMYTCFVYFFCQ